MVERRVQPVGHSLRLGWTVLVVVVVVASGFVVTAVPVPSPVHRTPVSSVPPSSPATFASGAARSVAVPRAAGDAGDLALSSASAGSVVRTVFPGFNTSLPGSFTSSVATWQVGTPTYVPSTDTLWFPQRSVPVPGYPTPTIAPAAVYNLSTGGFTELVTNLSNASALAYDPGNGYVYATLPASNSVAVVNPRTGAIVDSSIPVGVAPVALALDRNANLLFVANSGSSNVTVIDALTNTVSIPGVTVGADPLSLAFDPHDKVVFVTSGVTEFVYEINAASPTSNVNRTGIYYSPVSEISYSAISGNLVATDPSSAYATIINASRQALMTSIEVGQGVLSATTSANGTEFVLGNASGGDLVVLSTSNGSRVGNDISVDRDATELVVDPLSGQVFCWTSSSRILESVNLSSRVATPAAHTTSPELLSMSSLVTQSRVYVSSGNEPLIYGLDATQLRQSSLVLTGLIPQSVVSDPSNNRLYVGTSDGLSVFSATTGQLNATGHGLTGNCSQLVLDRPDNLLWLANDRLVYAVNLTTLQVEITTGLQLPAGSTQGIAIDAVDGDTFVLNSSSTVTVLTSLTGYSVGPGIGVGANVTSLAFDPADDQVYAAGDRVTMVDGATLAVDGSTSPLGVSHRVLSEVYEPSREFMYIASTGLLPGEQGTVTALDGSSVGASEASAVEVPVGEVPDAFGVVTSGNSTAPASAMIWVANELSGTISVLASPPQITYFGASPSPVDVGYPTSVRVTFVGGAGASVISYSGLPPGCLASNQPSLNCTPSAPGLFNVTATLTDTLGDATNATAPLVVARAMVVHPGFSAFPLFEAGVPFQVWSYASNGVPPYSYEISFGDGAIVPGPNATHTYKVPGTFVVMIGARDATGAVANFSIGLTIVAGLTVTLNAVPGNVTDVDLPVMLVSNANGGMGPRYQNWTFGDGTESSGPNASHAWTHSGNYTVTFAYTDGWGVTASRSMEVAVHPSLAATFSAGNTSSSSPATPGSPVGFSANISGGTPPYQERWSFGDGSYADGLSVNHSYASTGTYSVKVTLTDAVGASVTTTLSVTVAASPSSSGGVSALNGGFVSGLFLGLVLGGVAAAVVLFVAGLRKGGRPPAGPPTPYVPP
jgi:YVTN family beta-propeller protein